MNSAPPWALCQLPGQASSWPRDSRPTPPSSPFFPWLPLSHHKSGLAVPFGLSPEVLCSHSLGSFYSPPHPLQEQSVPGNPPRADSVAGKMRTAGNNSLFLQPRSGGCLTLRRQGGQQAPDRASWQSGAQDFRGPLLFPPPAPPHLVCHPHPAEA